MKKILPVLALFLSLLPASLPVHASPAAAVQAHISAQDEKDLSRIEDYLNGLKNVSAGFLQIDDAGGFIHGQLMLSRPGKMRVDYDPPNKDFIIADGGTVHIWNDDLKTQTNVDQGSSLAQFILRDPVKLGGDVTITKIARYPAKIEVTLVQTKDPGAGSLTLVFETKPLKLRQWKVIDTQGRLTGVNLENLSERAPFPDSTFVFTPPSFVKNP
jgi:outer membrane lipoprotein-sorting protein